MSGINTTFCQNILQIVFGILLNGCALFFSISSYIKYCKTKSTEDYSITYLIICWVIYLLMLPMQIGMCINTKENYDRHQIINPEQKASEWVMVGFLIVNTIVMGTRIPLFTILFIHKIRNDKLESPITFIKNIKLWILITTISICAAIMAFSLWYSLTHMDDNSWKWVTYINMFIGIAGVPQFLPQSLATIEKRETYTIPLLAFMAELVACFADIGNACILASGDGWSAFMAEILGDVFDAASILIIVVIKIKNKDHLRDKNGKLKTKNIAN